MLPKKNKEKILFGTQAGFEIAKLVFTHPHKIFHLRELERATGYSTTAINDALTLLHKYGIIIIQQEALTKNIQANLASDAYRFYKRVFNLYRLARYTFVQDLLTFFPASSCIVVYGSFAKGEDIEQSDIDILIITHTKNTSPPKDFQDIYQKEFERPLDFKIMTPAEFHQSSKEFKNAIANGIILHGYLTLL